MLVLGFILSPGAVHFAGPWKEHQAWGGMGWLVLAWAGLAIKIGFRKRTSKNIAEVGAKGTEGPSYRPQK